MPSISYALTVCNEHEELDFLFQMIIPYLRENDEIVVLVDSKNYTPEVWEVVQKHNVGAKFQYHRITHPMNGDFAEFKNFLKAHCSKEYVFFIDADEYPTPQLLNTLPLIIKNNPVDVLLVPRVNHVEGLTDEDINKWGWRVDERGRVNWPDFQFRVCVNSPNIKWEGKVHEKLTGYKTITQIPFDNEFYSLIHNKGIERQRRQNTLYENL